MTTVAIINFCSPRGKSSNPLSKPFKQQAQLVFSLFLIALTLPYQVPIISMERKKLLLLNLYERKSMIYEPNWNIEFRRGNNWQQEVSLY